MEKFYTSLGLMSGTSMDGVDASIIRSDGESNYEPIFDKYFEYDEVIYSDLLNLRGKINSIKDLSVNSYQINELERKITLFHAKISKEIIKNTENRCRFSWVSWSNNFSQCSGKNIKTNWRR